MKNQKVNYYKDELKDEFSEAKIVPRRIDEKYIYNKSLLWDFCSFIMQNILTMPLKVLFVKIKFRQKFIGKDKLKKCKRTGYFIYGNHTQPFADTFIPSLANYPKRNFLIANPENVSMNGLKTIAEMAGAIPIPRIPKDDEKLNLKAMKNFLSYIKKIINKNYSITIYPEAHIWPYYTKIRNFKSVSFKYPIQFEKPAYCITNTYQSYGKNKDKIKIVSYVDGPFYYDKNLKPKEAQEKLRNDIYYTMCDRAKNSNIEYIKYIKKD